MWNLTTQGGGTHIREKDSTGFDITLESPTKELKLIGGKRLHEYEKHLTHIVEQCGTILQQTYRFQNKDSNDKLVFQL